MSEEILLGFILGICFYLLVRKLVQMNRDIAWCKVYVDNHLAQEQKESLKK